MIWRRNSRRKERLVYFAHQSHVTSPVPLGMGSRQQFLLGLPSHESRLLKIAKVFSGGGDVHYVLPHFQREYAWDKENWQTLLDDVLGL